MPLRISKTSRTCKGQLRQCLQKAGFSRKLDALSPDESAYTMTELPPELPHNPNRIEPRKLTARLTRKQVIAMVLVALPLANQRVG